MARDASSARAIEHARNGHANAAKNVISVHGAMPIEQRDNKQSHAGSVASVSRIRQETFAGMLEG